MPTQRRVTEPVTEAARVISILISESFWMRGQLRVPVLGLSVLLVLVQAAAVGSRKSAPAPDESPHQAQPKWYNAKATAAFSAYLDSRLAPYHEKGLERSAVAAAMNIGACASGCDAREKRWNAHFQIINGTVLGVGGYGVFWNDHHRKRVKAVVTILRELVRLEPQIPDVEFVVNMHDYNKLLRAPAATLPWGADLARKSGLPGLDTEGAGLGADGGGGGAAGSFREHLPLWNGSTYDWSLHYRIYGNHFGNPLLQVTPTHPPTHAWV